MSTMPVRPPRKPGLAAWVMESFWIADVLVLGLIAFFIVVSGSESTGVWIVGCVLGLLYAVHAVWRHDHNRGRRLPPEARRARERRGF